jgi:tetratricopeptide (TPR) repeat protein
VNVIRKAKGDRLRRQSQRIFLCLDERNISDADSLIADRLLPNVPSADYIVSYLEAPAADLDMDLLREEIKDTSVMVLWVTEELLASRKAAGKWPSEYQFAREMSVHIIPFVKDVALFPEFTRLSGAIHGIGQADEDFLIKYYSQLSSYQYTEDTVKTIRDKAFTAEIFLSYRKKNIREAREFMRKLHDIEGFETISIWYDNFLTAGRNFDDEIKESIRKSDAFVLLVTPDLATEGNYVQTTEYPFALENGKTIIPVEAASTDLARFESLYPDAQRVLPVDEKAALRDAFIKNLKFVVSGEPMGYERAYFLGLSYLNGFGVERDIGRAFRLLETAAEGDDAAALHACFPLCFHYGNGSTGCADYKKALYYRKRSVDLSERLLGAEHRDTAVAYYDMANLCAGAGDYEQAALWSAKVTSACEKAFGLEHEYTAAAYALAGRVAIDKGDYAKSVVPLEKALAINEKVLGDNHQQVAAAYGNLGTAYMYIGDLAKAMEYSCKTMAIYEDLYGKGDSRTAMIYQNIGGIYNELGDYSAAMEWLNKALTSQQKAFMSDEHRDCAVTYNTLAVVYANMNQDKKAIEAVKKALSINVRTLGMSHPDTIGTQQSMLNLNAAIGIKRNQKIAGWALLAFIVLFGIAAYVLSKVL